MFHIEWPAAFATIGSVGTIITVLVNAHIGSYKRRIEQLEREFGEFKAEHAAVKSDLAQARNEIVTHYTARLDIAEENRELHKRVESLQEQVISFVKATAAFDNRISAKT